MLSKELAILTRKSLGYERLLELVKMESDSYNDELDVSHLEKCVQE